jgi:hypothetical protein
MLAVSRETLEGERIMLFVLAFAGLVAIAGCIFYAYDMGQKDGYYLCFLENLSKQDTEDNTPTLTEV